MKRNYPYASRNLLTISLLGAALIPCASRAQLLITSGSQSTTIDFQSDVGWDGPTSDPTAGDDVFKWKNGPMTDPVNYFRNALERNSWGWGGSNDYGPSAEAWSWRASGLDLGGGSGERTFFGDYNNDGDLVDGLDVIAGVNFIDMATLGIGSASDYAYAIGRNGGNNAPWRDFSLTLRVKNGSGATISDWNVSLDTWYADPDSGNTNVSLAYSTDNVNFTPIDIYTTTNNGGVYTQRNLSGSIGVAIADGGYLYLQFANLRPSGGSGAGIVIDNWTVTAASGGPAPVAPQGVAVAIVGADVQLSFDSVDGQNYQLLVSTDDMASFAPVGEPGSSGTGDGSPLTLTDTGGTPSSGQTVFYQVEAN